MSRPTRHPGCIRCATMGSMYISHDPVYPTITLEVPTRKTTKRASRDEDKCPSK